jgi:hypothetical protein
LIPVTTQSKGTEDHSLHIALLFAGEQGNNTIKYEAATRSDDIIHRKSYRIPMIYVTETNVMGRNKLITGCHNRRLKGYSKSCSQSAEWLICAQVSESQLSLRQRNTGFSR